ncbi:mucin-binding protein, partial [Lactobacillus amylovorus]|uniref:mucin-binding protein n=1 Tax=Lactobacillus amylovorus TaxID=1604 RepID=UPI003F8A86C7
FATAPTDEIANYKKQGYVLVSNSFDNNKYQADNNNNVFYVHFIHGTKKVNREHSASFTVHYIYKDGGQAKPDHEQTLSFTENGIQDLVTQKITWTPADSQKFDDVATPVITGYTPDQDKVIGQTAKFETDNREVTVTYLPDVQLGHINYIDDNTGKTLTRDDFSGRTNEHEDYTPIDRIQKFENKGYELVSNDYPDGGFNFDDNDQQEQVFNVHLKHGIVTVTTKKPQTPNMPINPDPQSPKYPKDISNTNSDVKRTIDYKFKDGKTAQPTVNDSLHFERTVVIDKVTGDVLSDTWTPSQDFNDVQTPVIQGYTPDRTVVSDTNIGHDHQNIVEHVIYNPDAQHMTITYVDDTTRETLKQDKLDGTSDQDAKYTTGNSIKQYEDQHYKLVSDSTNGKDLIFDHDDNANQTYEVHFVHGTQKVNRQDTVTSTIDYKFEDGKTAQPTVTQTKHFSEDGVKDLVTGKIAWDEANPQKFDDVATPDISGYTPDKDNVAGSTVKFGDKDVEVTVTYHNNVQKAVITYIDDTEKKTLGSDKQDGKFNQVIIFEHDPAEVIKGSEEKGYKLVSDNFKPGIKYQNDNKLNIFEVHLVHTYEPVETSQTITETVHYIDANGKPVAPDHVAKVVIKVTGTRDKVTDSIIWNTPSTGHFDEVISPEVPNMTPDKKLIPGRDVQYGDSDITESVVYTPDNSTSKTPEKPDKPSKEVSKTPEKPDKPSKEVSKIPEKPNKSSKEVSKAPEKSIDSRTVDNHVSAKSTAKRELPQTGATTNTGIWTGLVSMIASLGLLGASKRRKKN